MHDRAETASPASATGASEEDVARFRDTFRRLEREVHKLIVGNDDVIELCLTAIVCGGHVLLEGVPGLGKTALVNTIARALELDFKRIQFTPDLLPADIVGTDILVERDGHKVFEFRPGPVFCQVLLADEINRATPKTQSALLETMQEASVTVAGKTHLLKPPFFVLATQNPIEQDGTYPLPEAQLDRFFFKLHVGLPDHAGFAEILKRTGGAAAPAIAPVAHGDDVLAMGRVVREVPVAPEVVDHLICCVRRTHPDEPTAPGAVKRFVRHGASPRAAQTILQGARVAALLDGRYHVAREDIEKVAVPAMRHRLLLSFEGEAEGIDRDVLIREVLATSVGG